MENWIFFSSSSLHSFGLFFSFSGIDRVDTRQCTIFGARLFDRFYFDSMRFFAFRAHTAS